MEIDVKKERKGGRWREIWKMEKVRDFPREIGIAKEGFADTKEPIFLPKGLIVFYLSHS